MAVSSELTGEFSTLFVEMHRPPGDSMSRNLVPNVELRHAEAVIRRMLRRPGPANDPVCQRIHEAAEVLRTALVDTESVRIRDLSGQHHGQGRDAHSPAFRLAKRVMNQLVRGCRQSAT